MNSTMRAFHISVLAVLALFSLSCSGNGGEDMVLELTADRTVIHTGDGNAVTFSAMYGGEDVSTSPDFRLSWTSEDGASDLEPGVNTFSPETEGTYVFTATYSTTGGTVTSNSVEITVTPEPVIRDYARQILAMQFTSVGCVNCPAMSTGLKTVQGENPGRVNVVSFHQFYGNVADPMECEMTSLFTSRFGVTGLPQCYLDMRPEKVTADISDLKTSVGEALGRKAASGLAVESSVSEGKVSVTVRITSNESAVFRYLIFLVEDGIEYMQYGADESPYIHNNVVRSVLSTSSNGERVNSGNPLMEGVEYTSSRTSALDDSWNADNMRIVVASLVSEDDGMTYICANSVSCPLGGSAGYDLNE